MPDCCPHDLGKQIIIRRKYISDSVNGYGISVGGPGVGSINKARGRPTGGLVLWDKPGDPVPTAIGEWQEIEIVVIGNRIETVVNGTKVCEYTDETDAFKFGEISFVCRGDSRIVYRSILLQELDERGMPSMRPAPIKHDSKANGKQKGNSTPPDSVAQDSFQVGSKWVGEYAVTRSGGTSVRLPVNIRVLQREKTRFRARYEIEGQGLSHHVREILGTITNGEFGWFAKDVIVRDGDLGHEGHDHAGWIDGNSIILNFSGSAQAAAFEGQTVSGTVTLSREAE